MKSIILLILSAGILLAKPALQKIGNDFERPIWLGSPDHSSQLLFIVEQAGRVWIYDQKTNQTLKKPFLDIRERVSRRDNEEGLLGFDFAPDYAKSGRFYVNYSNKNRTNEIVRFTVPNPTEALSCNAEHHELLLSYKQPFGNHNGGYLEFGPDGLLYIGTGDGGAANDPENNAQNTGNLLGKILRIDVSGEKGYAIPKDNPFAVDKNARPEILAYGLRNPWRCCWDQDLFYIADVGQNLWEEVNVVTSRQLNGANFGWRKREGLIKTPQDGVGGSKPKDAIEPIYVYKHGGGSTEGLSINGGYVYRGSVKSLQGKYFFSDHVNPRIWSLEFKNGKATSFADHSDELSRPDGARFRSLCSFGQDADKELYIIELGGGIWKIIED